MEINKISPKEKRNISCKRFERIFLFLVWILILVVSPFCSKKSSELLTINGGVLKRGILNPGNPDQSPIHEVRVSSFLYQSKLVTIADFEKFQLTTGHITTAEKKGYCMTATEGMKDWEWEKKEGANYKYPFGQSTNPETTPKPDLPATCLSYADTIAYCKFLGMRLPTEAEWEYAHRAGSKKRFPWGDERQRNGNYLLNYWQGITHEKANSKDGHKYLSSVDAFPPNVWGIYDPVGNVWQMTLDYYSKDIYQKIKNYNETNANIVLDPIVSKDRISFEKEITTESRKFTVTRGGSWWCSDLTCNGFGLYYRGKFLEDTVFSNNGFRCARDLP